MEDLNANVMSWDDEVSADDTYTVLPEGDYNFKVVDFERGSFPGSQKMAAGPKAVLTLEVNTPEGTARVKEDLILNKMLEWKISSFFRSIGQKEHGKPLKPDWTKVLGSSGRAHFKPRADKNDATKFYNGVDKFIDYDPKNFSDGWVKEAEKAPVEEADW